jgi:hypothetical protein
LSLKPNVSAKAFKQLTVKQGALKWNIQARKADDLSSGPSKATLLPVPPQSWLINDGLRLWWNVPMKPLKR